MSTVYITGGATGIGAATVRKFATHGDDVAVFDVNRTDVEKLAADLDSGSVHFFETDVRHRDGVRRSVAAAAAALGPPTTLFVNAGVQKLQGIFEMEDADSPGHAFGHTAEHAQILRPGEVVLPCGIRLIDFSLQGGEQFGRKLNLIQNHRGRKTVQKEIRILVRSVHVLDWIEHKRFHVR